MKGRTDEVPSMAGRGAGGDARTAVDTECIGRFARIESVAVVQFVPLVPA